MVDFTPKIRDAFGAYTKLIIGAGEFLSTVPLSSFDRRRTTPFPAHDIVHLQLFSELPFSLHPPFPRS